MHCSNNIVQASNVIVQLRTVFRNGSADSLSELQSSEYDTRCYFNVRSKADISQLNLPHGTDN